MTFPFQHRPQTDSIRLAWSGDPAFEPERFVIAEGKDAGKPDPAAWREAWRVAVETLDFAPLCKPGQTPTYLSFRPLADMTRRRLLERYHDTLGQLAWAAVVRATLVSIDGWPKDAPPLQPVTDPALAELGPILTEEVINFLGAIAPGAVNELAQAVIARGSPQGK